MKTLRGFVLLLHFFPNLHIAASNLDLNAGPDQQHSSRSIKSLARLRPVAIKPARDLTVAVDVKLYPGTNITNKQQEVQEKEFYDSASGLLVENNNEAGIKVVEDENGQLSFIVGGKARKVGQFYVKKKGQFDFTKLARSKLEGSKISQPFRASKEKQEQNKKVEAEALLDLLWSDEKLNIKDKKQTGKKADLISYLPPEESISESEEQLRASRQSKNQDYDADDYYDYDNEYGDDYEDDYEAEDRGRTEEQRFRGGESRRFQAPRQQRQLGGTDGQNCRTEGYDTRVRDDCQEVIDTVCNTVQVTKYRTEIDQQCKTKIDQKCRPIETNVPKQECKEKIEKRCTTKYEWVPEQSYDEECHETIDTVCEKTVEIAVPVKVPYPVPTPQPYHVKPTSNPYYVKPSPMPYQAKPTPTPHHHKSTPTVYQHKPTPTPYRHKHNPTSYQSRPSPQPYHLKPTPQPYHPKPTTQYYQPTPTQQPYHPKASPSPLHDHLEPRNLPHHPSPKPTLYTFTPSPYPPHSTIGPYAPSSPTPYFRPVHPEPKAPLPTPRASLPHPSTISTLPASNLNHHRNELLKRFNSQQQRRDATIYFEYPDLAGNPTKEGQEKILRLKRHFQSFQATSKQEEEKDSIEEPDHQREIKKRDSTIKEKEQTEKENHQLKKRDSDAQFTNILPGSRPDLRAFTTGGQDGFLRFSSPAGSPSLFTTTLTDTSAPLGEASSALGGALVDTGDIIKANKDKVNREAIRKRLIDLLAEEPKLLAALGSIDTESATAKNKITAGAVKASSLLPEPSRPRASLQDHELTQLLAGTSLQDLVAHDTSPIHSQSPEPVLGGPLLGHRESHSSQPVLGGPLLGHHESHSSEPALGGPLVGPHASYHPDHVLPQHPGDQHYDLLQEKVIQQELPAPPGCRSIATKKCHKVPVVKQKKVPRTQCEEVPGINCFFVLKKVADLECAPTSYQDCTDLVKEVPYLAPEEQCEDVAFEECVEIEEQVPIQVCTTVDPSREAVTTNVGNTYRNRSQSRSRSRTRIKRGRTGDGRVTTFSGTRTSGSFEPFGSRLGRSSDSAEQKRRKKERKQEKQEEKEENLAVLREVFLAGDSFVDKERKLKARITQRRHLSYPN